MKPGTKWHLGILVFLIGILLIVAGIAVFITSSIESKTAGFILIVPGFALIFVGSFVTTHGYRRPIDRVVEKAPVTELEGRIKKVCYYSGPGEMEHGLIRALSTVFSGDPVETATQKLHTDHIYLLVASIENDNNTLLCIDRSPSINAALLGQTNPEGPFAHVSSSYFKEGQLLRVSGSTIEMTCYGVEVARIIRGSGLAHRKDRMGGPEYTEPGDVVGTHCSVLFVQEGVKTEDVTT